RGARLTLLPDPRGTGAGDETAGRGAAHGFAHGRTDARHLSGHGFVDPRAHSIRRDRDVVVAAMNRLAWAAAALGATGFLAALAFTGGRGGPGPEAFVAERRVANQGERP